MVKIDKNIYGSELNMVLLLYVTLHMHFEKS